MKYLRKLVCLVPGFILCSHATAALIQIDYTADLSAFVSGSQPATGQFILDTSIGFQMNQGGIDGPVVGGFLDLDSNLTAIDPNSLLSFVAGGNRPDYSILGVYGDIGGGNFIGVELVASSWANITTGWDALIPGVMLDDLLPFDAFEESTRLFVSLGGQIGYAEFYDLSISRVVSISEPSSFCLLALGVSLLSYRQLRRRRPGAAPPGEKFS